MNDSRLLALIGEFEAALAERDEDRALLALSELEALDPADPAWPKRCAEIYRHRRDEAAELNALIRAASLQVDAGLVARAMASCKRILTLSPGHPSTEQMLSLLYEMPSSTFGQNRAINIQSAPSVDLSKVSPPCPESQIQEIVLTEAVADTRSVSLAELEEFSAAAEIPIGRDRTEKLELFLDDVPEEEQLLEEPMALSPVGADESQSQLLMGSLFRAIGPDGVRDLVNNGEIIDLDAEVLVFSQGDAADRLYVVLEGAVVPVSEESNGMKGGIRMGVIESGDFFGEIGLLTDQPRNATIRTLVETRLLAINRKAVWHLLSNHEETLTLLLRTLRTRLIDRLVRTHPMFNLFGRAKQGAFAKQFRLIEVRDGSTVIQQGLKHQGLYVVLAGQLEIVESSGRGDKSLGIAEHGDVLGEFSELFEQAAHASVIARSRCWLLNLTHPRFKSIVNSNPRLNELLVQIAEKRDTERRAAYGVSEDPRGGR